MDKTFHFISGLPRSGSTLLANILAQNPRFETTASSAILGILMSIREQWGPLFAATPNEQAKVDVMRGVLHSYYQRSAKPMVFDKCRGWLAYLEMAELLLDRKARVLVPVRDMRDILASFEKLWRHNAATTQIPQEKAYPLQFQSLEGRCDVWLQKGEPLGLAYMRIEDALTRGFRDRLHFVRFEELTGRPAQTMKAIYKFLDEEPFEHSFDHVEQVTWEDDAVHGFKGLHDIRSKVEPLKPQYPAILGKLAEKYKGVYVWDQPQWK
ncbi:MAG: sulfotransferase [Phycisphaeraceae bacterium]